jgi:hypothetical protein
MVPLMKQKRSESTKAKTKTYKEIFEQTDEEIKQKLPNP